MAGSVVIVKTTNMRTAAVLLANGYEFHAGRRLADRGLVEFDFLCREADKPEAERLMDACRHGYDVTVHLGAYEKAFRQVREIVKSAGADAQAAGAAAQTAGADAQSNEECNDG